VLGVAVGGVSKQRVDRREPGVACGDFVAAIVLEVIQERGDDRGSSSPMSNWLGSRPKRFEANASSSLSVSR
jgi:hypothetical protein